MKLALLSLTLCAAAAGVEPQVAEACSFAPNATHALDPMFSSDVTPPGAPDVTAIVRRWEYPSTCFDIALIDVAVSAIDDAAPPERLGYRFRVAGGDPPDGLGIPDAAIAPPRINSGRVLLFFSYMDPAFAFELEVRAVDLNGNEGPPTVVAIADPTKTTDTPSDGIDDPIDDTDDNIDADGGCSATGSASSNALASLLMLGVLLLALRRR